MVHAHFQLHQFSFQLRVLHHRVDEFDYLAARPNPVDATSLLDDRHHLRSLVSRDHVLDLEPLQINLSRVPDLRQREFLVDSLLTYTCVSLFYVLSISYSSLLDFKVKSSMSRNKRRSRDVTNAISLPSFSVFSNDVLVLLRPQLNQFVLIIDVRCHSFQSVRSFVDAYVQPEIMMYMDPRTIWHLEKT